MNALDQSVSWSKLRKLAFETRSDRIADYFKADPARFNKMSLRFGELFLDYSKTGYRPR